MIFFCLVFFQCCILLICFASQVKQFYRQSLILISVFLMFTVNGAMVVHNYKKWDVHSASPDLLQVFQINDFTYLKNVKWTSLDMVSQNQSNYWLKTFWSKIKLIAGLTTYQTLYHTNCKNSMCRSQFKGILNWLTDLQELMSWI